MDSAILLHKTIVLVAAGGDSSRLQINANPSSIGSENLANSQCLATSPAPGLHDLTFLDVACSMIKATQEHHSVDIPFAIVTGPNTDSAIRKYVNESGLLRGHTAQIIQQASMPVFTKSGKVVFNINDAPVLAPDGTGGALNALVKSDFFHDHVEDGREYLFVWYINDLSSGQLLEESVKTLAAGTMPFVWHSDEGGKEAIKTLHQNSRESVSEETLLTLEDAPCVYTFRTEEIETMLSLAHWHSVERSTMTTDGINLVFKRERFLSDIVASFFLANNSAVPTASNKEKSGPSRQEKFANDLLENLSTCLRTDDSFSYFSWDIGEKESGTVLFDSMEVVKKKYGGFSVVYICKDRKTGEKRAVKTYTDDIRWGRPHVVRRFHTEAHRWVTLEYNPFVVNAERAVEIDGRIHLVLEYLNDGDLRLALERRPLDMRLALSIAVCVCSGLEWLHRHGIVHRDLKPENVMLVGDSWAKITDFGLAWSIEEQLDIVPVGTRAYMPPEQLCSPEDIGTYSDIYAFGVLIHELLTHTRPEPGHSGAAGNFEIPPALRSRILKCLSPDPKDRPSALDMCRLLKEQYQVLFHDEWSPPTQIANPITEANIDSQISSLIALGEFNKAEEKIDKLLKLQVDRKKYLNTLAWIRYETKRYEECIALCLKGYEIGIDGNKLNRLIEMSEARQGRSTLSADQWSSEGFLLFGATGDTSLALHYYEIALELDPRRHADWLHQGQCLYNLGRHEEAITSFEKALSSDDEKVVGFATTSKHLAQAVKTGTALNEFQYYQTLSKGKAALEKGDYPSAEVAFRTALSALPDGPEALRNLVRVLLETGRLEESLSYCETALDKNCADGEIWFLKGRIDSLLCRFSDAVSDYDRVLDLSEYQVAPLLNKGLALLDLGRRTQGERCFRMVLEIEPENGNASEGIKYCAMRTKEYKIQRNRARAAEWNNQGVRFLEESHIRSGLNCFRAGLRAMPEDPMLHANAGHALWRLGQFRASIAACNRALHFDPEMAEAWNMRGNALDDIGEIEEALNSYKRAINIDNSHFYAWNGKGLCLQRLDNASSALEAFDRACSIKDDFLQGNLNAASLLSEQGRHDEALVRYKRALEIEPNHKRIQSWIGTELFFLARYQESVSTLEDALILNPDDHAIWNALGGAQMMLGELQVASSCFKKALQIDPGNKEIKKNLAKAQSYLAKIKFPTVE